MSDQLSPQNDISPDSLADIFGKLLGSQVQGSADTAESTASASGSTSSTGNAQNPFGDVFSSLLSNPELLIKLPSIISAAKPIIDIFSQSQRSVSIPASDSVAAGTNLPTPQNSHSSTAGREVECRNALLCAMKPYLSRDRQNTIDYIVKLSRLGDILKTL